MEAKKVTRRKLFGRIIEIQHTDTKNGAVLRAKSKDAAIFRLDVEYDDKTVRFTCRDADGVIFMDETFKRPILKETVSLVALNIAKNAFDGTDTEIDDKSLLRLANEIRHAALPCIKREKAFENQAGEIVNLAQLNCQEFFTDERGVPCGAINIKESGSIEVVPIESDRFKNLLPMWFFKAHDYRRAPSPEALSVALKILKGIAMGYKKNVELNLRVAKNGDKIFYDTGNDTWEVIEVLPGAGWRIKPHTSPIFKRYPHMLPQVEPEADAEPDDFKRLLKYVNIKKDDEIIFLSHVASFIVPEIQHPIMILHGSQGAGKTTLFRMIRMLVDPSACMTLSFPRRQGDLLVCMEQNLCLFFDNISKITQEQSDMLCRAVTGEAQTNRKLYTNNDAYIFKFNRIIGLNGIVLPGDAPDFLDRAVIYNMQHISRKKCQEYGALLDKFQNERPKIFGGLLRVVSNAMALINSVHSELHGKLPRMSEFATWGEAIARALGYQPMDFYKAYVDKLDWQKQELTDTDVVFHLINKLLSDGEHLDNSESTKKDGNTYKFAGTPTELYKELLTLAKTEKLSGGFPKNPRALSARINRLQIDLLNAGIKLYRERSNDKWRSRIIRLERAEFEDEKPDEKPTRRSGIEW